MWNEASLTCHLPAARITIDSDNRNECLATCEVKLQEVDNSMPYPESLAEEFISERKTEFERFVGDRAKDGNPVAWQYLIESTIADVQKIARARVRQPDFVEDAVNTVYEKALANFDPARGLFSHYVKKLAYYLSRRVGVPDSEPLDEESPSGSVEPPDWAFQSHAKTLNLILGAPESPERIVIFVLIKMLDLKPAEFLKRFEKTKLGGIADELERQIEIHYPGRHREALSNLRARLADVQDKNLKDLGIHTPPAIYNLSFRVKKPLQTVFVKHFCQDRPALIVDAAVWTWGPPHQLLSYLLVEVAGYSCSRLGDSSRGGLATHSLFALLQILRNLDLLSSSAARWSETAKNLDILEERLHENVIQGEGATQAVGDTPLESYFGEGGGAAQVKKWVSAIDLEVKSALGLRETADLL